MKKKLLLVEDRDSLRMVIGSILSPKYSVMGTRNGLEALSALGTGQLPDLIISDVAMPELDGIALLQLLQCSGLYAHIPVLMLNEEKSTLNEAYFKQLGAKDVLSKPFKIKDLEDKVLRLTGAYASIGRYEVMADTSSPNVVFG